MDRFYYSIFGPSIVQFLELKSSFGYKYYEGSWALSLFDRLALGKGVDRVGISNELAEEYSAIRPNETGTPAYMPFLQLCGLYTGQD